MHFDTYNPTVKDKDYLIVFLDYFNEKIHSSLSVLIFSFLIYTSNIKRGIKTLRL